MHTSTPNTNSVSAWKWQTVPQSFLYHRKPHLCMLKSLFRKRKLCKLWLNNITDWNLVVFLIAQKVLTLSDSLEFGVRQIFTETTLLMAFSFLNMGMPVETSMICSSASNVVVDYSACQFAFLSRIHQDVVPNDGNQWVDFIETWHWTDRMEATENIAF